MKIKNVEVHGLERAIKASGVPMTLGEIDSLVKPTDHDIRRGVALGNVPRGAGDDNYLKGIIVQFDMQIDQAQTQQLQRYHFFDIISSQSKMHCLTKNEEFTLENRDKSFSRWVDQRCIDVVNEKLAEYKELFQAVKNHPEVPAMKKELYEKNMELVHSLPCGYYLWQVCTTNYQQLKTIIFQRYAHKLKDDWSKAFCRDFILKLPMFKELCLDSEKGEKIIKYLENLD